MMKKIILTTIFLVNIGILFLSPINAQGVCDFFPCGDGGVVPGPGDPIPTGVALFRFAVGLIFTGFIAFGVYQIIKSGIKIIQSEGDESKVEEAAKAIKGVFIGIGMLLLGIIGIVVLLAFFGDASFLQNEIPNPDGLGI